VTPVPLDLPVNPSEAVVLADLIFDHAGNRPLTEDLRGRLAVRAATLRLETLTPWFGSLERDPVHPGTFYLAADAARGPSLLLHIAPAAAPTSGVYPRALLLARNRSGADREVVINSIPFGPGDRENIRQYAERVNTVFLPRPQGVQSAIVVCGGNPCAAMPAAFETFRGIMKRTGKKAAALAGDYHVALWSAIRAGWREGFNLETEAAAGRDSAELATCTRFRARLPLEAAAEAYEAVRKARAASRFGRAFDFELVPGGAIDTGQLTALLESWRGRGYPLQAISVPLAAWEQAAPLAAAARQHQAVLSFTIGPGTPDETLDALAHATLGRLQARIEFAPGDTREHVLERTTAIARRLVG